jgi:hypothetical protein
VYIHSFFERIEYVSDQFTMNYSWQSILKFNLTEWKKSPFANEALAAFEFLTKTDEESGKKSAKIEIRNFEKDKAAIGVTLTLHNWDNIREHLENNEQSLYSLSRTNDHLIVARTQEDFVHLFSDENGKIFGIKLRKEIVERLVRHKEALDFVMKLATATDSNGERIQKLVKYVFAFVVYSTLKKDSQKSCMACMFEADGEFVDDTTPHTCFLGKTGEEVVASQSFATTLASPLLDGRFSGMYLALAKHLNLPMESATNIKNVYAPLLRSSEDLRCIVKDAINGRSEYFFALDSAMQTYRNAQKPVSVTLPKKRRYQSPYEL